MAMVFQEMESETVCLHLSKEENERVFLLSQQVGRWGERVFPLPLALTRCLKWGGVALCGCPQLTGDVRGCSFQVGT